ncbi:MAG: hypothetical protein UT67_C0011G0013, partial [Candidatus Magasanikbacteria bacterium GW2011_GWA2_40_10]
PCLVLLRKTNEATRRYFCRRQMTAQERAAKLSCHANRCLSVSEQ